MSMSASPNMLTPRQLAMRRARGHPGLLIGCGIIFMIVSAALLAPVIAPYSPFEQNIANRLADPIWSGGSLEHVLGTDRLGRDTLTRLLYGAQITLLISVAATLIAATIGTTLGLVGGYFGGRADTIVLYLVNVKLALPIILIALAIIAIMGSSIGLLIVVLGFLTWDRYAVVTRSLTQQFRDREFVMAARAAGASDFHIVVREILPNLTSHIIVLATLEMATLILIESALSFLGLGVTPPLASWGTLIADGRSLIFLKPQLVVIPGLAILMLVMAINLAGDGLRDVLAVERR